MSEGAKLEQRQKRRKSGKRAPVRAHKADEENTLQYIQIQQASHTTTTTTATTTASAMNSSQPGLASFLSRLMSLSAHELECVHADGPLMRHLADTSLLLERSLQSIQQQQHRAPMQHQLEQQHIQQQQQQCLLRVAPVAQLAQYQANNLPQQQHQTHLAYISADSRYIYQFGGGGGGVEQLHAQQALDLRLPHSATPGASPHPQQQQHHSELQQQQQPKQLESRHQLNPKKVKLGEWRREQVNQQQQQQLSVSTQQLLLLPQTQLHQHQQQQQVKGPAKRYKGEFDEPTWAEVEHRQRELTSGPHNYHRALSQAHRHLGECACVLGSRFQDQRPVGEVLAMIDCWSRLPIEQRLQAKWDLCHLPVDIPLADIKKYEDLRRVASDGRADFGGASKRKPLGIRGTRQFLLILYCLWGHPGRQDRMQREGYCPHCFAKIKKSNEQSTLVRVVNHFNMKHRKGANPRLSPAARLHHISSSAVSPVQSIGSPPHLLASPQTQLLLSQNAHKHNQQPQEHQPDMELAPNQHNQQQHHKSHLFANLLLLAASSASAASSQVTPQASPPTTPPTPTTDNAATATCRLAAAPEPGTTQGNHHAVA